MMRLYLSEKVKRRLSAEVKVAVREFGQWKKK